MTIAVSTNSPKQDEAFKTFLAENPDIAFEEIQMADMYDENGNYKEIDLSHPGLPITKAYMSWLLSKSKQSIAEGNGLSLDNLQSFLQSKRDLYFSNR